MRTVLWLVAVLLSTQSSFGQSIFASLVGTVTDASSAAIPGAKVTATNISTNEQRQFITNQSGNYELNNLFPGVYLLEIEISGFAKYRRERISLAANETARADATLVVSSQATEVGPFTGRFSRISPFWA